MAIRAPDGANKFQDIVRTMFQLMVPVPNNDVTKHLTGHKMHVEGPQIS